VVDADSGGCAGRQPRVASNSHHWWVFVSTWHGCMWCLCVCGRPHLWKLAEICDGHFNHLLGGGLWKLVSSWLVVCTKLSTVRVLHKRCGRTKGILAISPVCSPYIAEKTSVFIISCTASDNTLPWLEMVLHPRPP
jgi:hypothetical protein